MKQSKQVKETKYTKENLVNVIAEKNSITRTEAKKYVACTLEGIEAIVSKMKPHDKLSLVGYLTLVAVHKEAKTAHKPGKPSSEGLINVPAKNVIKAKVGTKIKEALQQ